MPRFLLKLWVGAGLTAVVLASPTPSVQASQDAGRKAKSLAYYTMGVVYDLQGLTEEAVEEFKKSAEYDSTRAVHLRLGADYARLGNLPEAIEQLQIVLHEDPTNVQARYLLALIYSTEKRFDKAAEEYERILTSFSEAQPENLEIYGYLGQLYYAQKDYDRAIEQFETILSLQPSDIDMMYILGSLYLEVGRREEAIDIFKRAIKVDPEHDGCLNSLGYIYAEDGKKLDEAQKFVERALEIDPENGAYLDSLGWIYYKKGDYKNSLRYLKMADQYLKDPVIYEHIGDASFKLNRKDDARKYWTLSLELLPDQDQIREKLRSLK